MEVLSTADTMFITALACAATAYCSIHHIQQALRYPVEPLIPLHKKETIQAKPVFIPSRNILNVLEQTRKQCVIFYGSQTGTAERLAFQLSRDAKSRFGLECLVADLNDYDYDSILSLSSEKTAVFLLATYGEGEATDNAVTFRNTIDALMVREPRVVSTLCYAGFGLGNSSYQFYNEMVRRMETAFSRHAAHRIGEIGFGDDRKGGLEEDFLVWKSSILPQLASRHGLSEQPHDYQPCYTTVRSGINCKTDVFLGELNKRHLRRKFRGPYTLANPFASPLINARELCVGSARRFLHLEMDLSASTLSYEAGDHVAVQPTNSDQEVERFLKTFGLFDSRHDEIDISSVDPTIRVPIPTPTTYDSIARYYLDICAPVTRQFLETAASFAPYTSAWSKLKALASSADVFQRNVTARKLNIAQVLQTCGDSSSWSSVPFSLILESVPIMKPRYYSISSSPLVSRKLVSITTVVESETVPGSSESFKGVATNYLLALASPSAVQTHQISGPREQFSNPTCLISIRRSKFKLPQDPSIPIIMIGPGTGVAPLRGFVQSRAQQFKEGKKVGRTVLFYGCRRRSEDFLYEEEWQEYTKNMGSQILSVYTAFSREPDRPKTYVQHLFGDHAAELQNLICRQNAHVYVCGDAHSMARDVFNTMTSVVADDQCFRGDKDRAERYLKGMKSDGRWLEDVW